MNLCELLDETNSGMKDTMAVMQQAVQKIDELESENENLRLRCAALEAHVRRLTGQRDHEYAEKRNAEGWPV